MVWCNAMLRTLAEGYGFRSRIKLGQSLKKNSNIDKILADCFEAYFGVLQSCVSQGKLDSKVLTEYFKKLLSNRVFPKLVD